MRQLRRAIVACVALAGCRFGFGERTEPDGSVDPDGAVGQTEVRLVVTGWGALTGPNGIACADDCVVPVTGPVTITAVAGEGRSFDHFGPPCGAQPTCTVMPGETAAATFVANMITANRAFVSSVNAVLGTQGRNGLDVQCQGLATSAGLGGTFIAFVSTTAEDAVNRLAGSRGWVRLDGLPIIDQPTDLGADLTPRGVTFDELARPVLAQYVMTGSDRAGARISTETCGDWTVPSAGQSTGGLSDAGGQFLVGTSGAGCDSPVYCFEIGKSVAVTVAPPAFPVGRYVFVTPSFDPTTRISVADLMCQNDATAAGLPGTYKAMLATTTQSVIEHVGPLDGAWRRPDGASVTRTGLAGGNYDTSIGMGADRSAQPSFVSFGGPNLTDRATAAASCMDWSMTGTTVNAVAAFRTSPFSHIYTTSCQTLPVLCAQTQ